MLASITECIDGDLYRMETYKQQQQQPQKNDKKTESDKVWQCEWKCISSISKNIMNVCIFHVNP